MKKYLKILLSLIMVFALTGCVKYNTNMEVGKDKSVTLEIIYAIDTSMAENFASNMESDWDTDWEEVETEEEDYEDLDETNEINLFEEEKEEEEEDISSEGPEEVNKEDYEWLEKKGYKVEEYEYEKDGSKYVGVKISKKFKSIDDIAKNKDKEVDFTTLFNDKEKFNDSKIFTKKGSVYKADFVFDFTQDGKDVSDEYKSYQAMFDLKYTVKLPNKAKKHNASKVSDNGKTLTWNLKYGKKNKVEYQFEFGSSKTIILIIVAVIAVIAIIAGVVLLKKKPTQTVE